MNESIFFLHIFILIIFLLFSLKLGKTSSFIFVVFQSVFANLFVIKQIQFFSFTVTCSDVYIVSSVFGLNLIQEYFGKKQAKRCVNISFIFLILFLVVSRLHLLYIPSFCDNTQSSFQTIFQNTPRIIVASLSVFYIIGLFDVWFYSIIKKYFSNFFIKLSFSAIVSQLLDTILFSFLGLCGIVEKIFHVILISFVIKTFAIICSSFFVMFSKKVIKYQLPTSKRRGLEKSPSWSKK